MRPTPESFSLASDSNATTKTTGLCSWSPKMEPEGVTFLGLSCTSLIFANNINRSFWAKFLFTAEGQIYFISVDLGNMFGQEPS